MAVPFGNIETIELVLLEAVPFKGRGATGTGILCETWHTTVLPVT